MVVIVVQIGVGMGVRIDVRVVVDDVMIDHGVPVVQEVMWLIVHHLVHMMHWLHFMDGLVTDNLGRSVNVLQMAVVHVVIQVRRVAVVVVDGMRHSIHVVVVTIDHYGGAVAQMNAIGMVDIAVHVGWQLLVVHIVLQMGQQASLSHAQQSQSADEELKKTSTVRRNSGTIISRPTPTFIVEISRLIRVIQRLRLTARLRHLCCSAVVVELCSNPLQPTHFIELKGSCNHWPIARAARRVEQLAWSVVPAIERYQNGQAMKVMRCVPGQPSGRRAWNAQ